VAPTSAVRATPSIALPHRAAGNGTIVETRQAKVSPTEFLGQNRWVEQVGNAGIAVYAGASRSDPTQGVVVVSVEGKDPLTRPPAGLVGGTYPTPTRAGAVHVVDATGERLTLAAANGATFIFDVPSRSYVAAAH